MRYAIFYVAEHGCKWRGLPKRFGNWHTIDTRTSRRANSGVLDRAYEGHETRHLARDLGYTPVVPPSSTRLEPWEYGREMDKRRNEVERLCRHLKGYRRIFSRLEKLDVLFLAFICFAHMADGLRQCSLALTVHTLAQGKASAYTARLSRTRGRSAPRRTTC